MRDDKSGQVSCGIGPVRNLCFSSEAFTHYAKRWPRGDNLEIAVQNAQNGTRSRQWRDKDGLPQRCENDEEGGWQRGDNVGQLGKKMRRVSSTTKMDAPAARMMRSAARPAENLSTQMKLL
jgi:hypothetical protein